MSLTETVDAQLHLLDKVLAFRKPQKEKVAAPTQRMLSTAKVAGWQWHRNLLLDELFR